MPLLSEPSLASARPLPVVLLADISGSMVEYGKIDALNTAVAEMLASFGEEDDARARIHVAVITFGEEARLHQPFAPAVELRWRPMAARGTTPLGAALTLATTLIEDRGQIPSRAYRPTIIPRRLRALRGALGDAPLRGRPPRSLHRAPDVVVDEPPTSAWVERTLGREVLALPDVGRSRYLCPVCPSP